VAVVATWTLSAVAVAAPAYAALDAGASPDGEAFDVAGVAVPAPDASIEQDVVGPPAPSVSTALPPASAGTGIERPVPAYGRPAAPSTPGEAFVWGPRAILYPVHLAAEYVVRRPLVSFTSFGDRHYLWQRTYDLFTWNDGRAGVYPIADVEVALKSTAGVALFSRATETSPNSVHASAAASNEGTFDLRVRDHVDLWGPGRGGAYVHATWVRRPDGMYFGQDGISRQSDLRYYAYDDRAAQIGVDGRLGGMNLVSVELAARDVDFSTDTRSASRQSIATSYGGVGQPPLPAGFGGYGVLGPRLALALDSRDPRYEHPTGTGVRFEGYVGYTTTLRGASASFVPWGASLAGFWDVSGVNHVLALEVAARFTEAITGAVPFTELPTLGGQRLLGGFYGGRFRDESAIAAEVQYRYPIWIYVDSELFAGVGNTFPDHLDGFALDRLYLSYGIGLRTTFSREVSIVAMAGAGTRRFDDPDFRFVDATRLTVGAVRGF